MADTEVTIKALEKAPEKKEDVKEMLMAADAYAKLKEDNDNLEKEIARKEELIARINVSGRAQAGQYVPEKTPEEIAKEEANRLLKPFGH